MSSNEETLGSRSTEGRNDWVGEVGLLEQDLVLGTAI